MRYEAKLFLAFDANSAQEARASLDALMDDISDALEHHSLEHPIGVTIAEEDAQPQEVED